jgi:hypothetical protein
MLSPRRDHTEDLRFSLADAVEALAARVGMLTDVLDETPDLSDEEIRRILGGLASDLGHAPEEGDRRVE